MSKILIEIQPFIIHALALPSLLINSYIHSFDGLVFLTPNIDIHVLVLILSISKVEDGEYFQTLPENTIFILLRPGEAWGPAGEDIVSQGH